VPERLRVLSVVVQVQAVMDDGEHLTELDVPAINVPWREWPAFCETGLDGVLAQVAEQAAAAEPGA
jgi:hypothetical protein